MTVKEKVLSAIQKLPDDIDYKDVAEEVALLAAVREAERDVEEGRTVSNEVMKERIKGWTGG
jgi:predicted transcriptional regulator